jgi:glycosyltransferase involved in cell wall biosynthesis
MKEITIFTPALPRHGGGAQHIIIRLMSGFIKRGIKVKLVLAILSDDINDNIPSEVEIIHLKCKRTIYSIFRLAKYMKNNNPKNILSHLHGANRVVLMANLLARIKAHIHIVEHNTMTVALKESSLLNRILFNLVYKYLYPKATDIIHVSKAAAEDLQSLLPANAQKVITIYNPIVTNDILHLKNDDSPHPWFNLIDTPVILGVGRLTEQKNFINLIEAYFIVRKEFNARLVILGQGEQREQIEKVVRHYNLGESVYLPGYVQNPLQYMRKASVFVLSSNWEALPTVLVEAMACGCPVVSTDCPSGPAEILDNGKYGKLVPVRDPKALADAIIKTINDPLKKEVLQSRAMEFGADKAVDEYLRVIGKIK